MSQREFNILYDEWLKGVNGAYKTEWLVVAGKCIACQREWLARQPKENQL